jgi:hypothetical protein
MAARSAPPSCECLPSPTRCWPTAKLGFKFFSQSPDQREGPPRTTLALSASALRPASLLHRLALRAGWWAAHVPRRDQATLGAQRAPSAISWRSAAAPRHRSSWHSEAPTACCLRRVGGPPPARLKAQPAAPSSHKGAILGRNRAAVLNRPTRPSFTSVRRARPGASVPCARVASACSREWFRPPNSALRLPLSSVGAGGSIAFRACCCLG